MSNGIFSFDVYQQRPDRTTESLRNCDADAAAFGTGADLQYLIGSVVTSHKRLTVLVVTAVGTTMLILLAAEHGDPLLCAVGDLNADMVLQEDGENPHRIVADLVGHVGALAVGVLLAADHLISIQDPTGTRVVLTEGPLKEPFTCKDATGIDQLCEAGAAIGYVYARAPGMLHAGRTERKVADETSAAVPGGGHVIIGFVIAGPAENGASPHHDFSDCAIEEGDMVVVGIGGTLPLGYRSDCTRTCVVGKSGKKEAAVWMALRKVQETAVTAMRLGTTTVEIDVIACNSLTAAGYGKYFIHRTDHGISLSMHGEPFVMADNKLRLEPGMAFSVEPGVYLPGKFGMRLGDTIIVIEDGGEPVNNGLHDLITV